MNRNRPTMKDVADLAQVSVKTVSRVVNGEQWVSADATSRVREAIATLGYRLDARARAMRNPELAGRTIGVVHAELGNPFFAHVHSGIEEAFGAAGWLIVTASSRDLLERQDKIVRMFSDRRVDGMIVIPAAEACPDGTGNVVDLEVERGTPFVFVDRKHDDRSDVVLSDNYGGAVTATQHLLDHGHREIAFLGDDARLYSAQERLRGFTDTMAAANLPTPWVLMDITTEAEAADATRQLLAGAECPTALFAGKNRSSAGVVEALHDLGRQRDVALIGFDDVAMAHLIEPGITVVAQNAPELGRLAGELLLERIVDGRTEPVERIVDVTLITRGSGEISAS